MRKNTLVALMLILSGCIGPGLGGLAPGSRPYRPLEWEADLLQRATKTVMPSDIVQNPEQHVGELIHWVGVVDTFTVRAEGDSIVSEIRFEQHYYDYIEDFSIQDETMFVSPLGGGPFVYRSARAGMTADSVARTLAVIAERGNLGFVYGTLSDVRDGQPLLVDGRVRFVPEQLFSTAIFSYDVRRDADGRVVASESGFPELTDFDILQIAGPGQND